MSSTRWILEKSTVMILSSFKVIIIMIIIVVGLKFISYSF